MPRGGPDVVVVGAGLAGLSAALAAREGGARVVVLEKTDAPGGSTVTSGGSFAFGGTAEQRDLGIDDSPERLREDLARVGGGAAEPALQDLYVARQLDTHGWLKRQGVQFHKVSLSSNTSVPRTHPTRPRQVIEALLSRAREAGVDLRTGAAALRLLPASDPAAVGGVQLGDGARLEAGAVVLASGGFARNADMVRRYAPALAQAHAWGGAGNTGDGIAMALPWGAALADMDFVAGTFGVAIARYPETEPRPGDEVLLRMAMYRGAVAVNLEGRRFADESLSYKKLGTLCLAQPRGIAFQVFDQPIMAQSAPAPNLNDFEDALAKGAIRRAESLPELARSVGLDAGRLVATIERYNHDIEHGVPDEFGRRTLGGGVGTPVPLRTPPYYVLPCCTALLATYCGLRVDTLMRVKTAQDLPIAGLYAAGETVGGFHGAGYMSGSALGKAAIFGRVAGAEAARFAHEQRNSR